jgi:hypothetical protein
MVERRWDPFGRIHDGAVQTEYALCLLVQGRNLYSEDVPARGYGALSGESAGRPPPEEPGVLHVPNPARYHYIYPPLVTLQSLPLYVVLHGTVGWFDQRLMLVPYLLFLVCFACRLPASETTRSVALGLLANPWSLHFLLSGRNDIFVFSWLLLTAHFLHQGRSRPALLALAVACLMKQTAWIFAPFFYLFLYHQWQPISGRDFLKRAARESLLPLLIAAAVMLPFLIWDPRGLWDDLILYPAGTLPTSFPVKGATLLSILVRLSALESDSAYYPIVLAQVPAYLAILAWTHARLKKSPTMDTLLLQTAFGIATFWFLSRFYFDNYIEFTLRIAALSWIYRRLRTEETRPAPA